MKYANSIIQIQRDRRAQLRLRFVAHNNISAAALSGALALPHPTIVVGERTELEPVCAVDTAAWDVLQQNILDVELGLFGLVRCNAESSKMPFAIGRSNVNVVSGEIQSIPIPFSVFGKSTTGDKTMLRRCMLAKHHIRLTPVFGHHLKCRRIA